MPFTSNYPASVRVEALLWKVPEEVAASPAILMGSRAATARFPRAGHRPRSPAAQPVTPAVETAFFRNVLGSDVPRTAAFEATGGCAHAGMDVLRRRRGRGEAAPAGSPDPGDFRPGRHHHRRILEITGSWASRRRTAPSSSWCRTSRSSASAWPMRSTFRVHDAVRIERLLDARISSSSTGGAYRSSSNTLSCPMPCSALKLPPNSRTRSWMARRAFCSTAWS